MCKQATDINNFVKYMLQVKDQRTSRIEDELTISYINK